MENSESYQKAFKRAEAKFGFYVHLGVYLVVISMLTVINFTSVTPYFWVKWPAMGWAVALLWHALAVFVLFDKSGVPEKMIRKEMEKELNN